MRAELAYAASLKIRPVNDDALCELVAGIEAISVIVKVIYELRARLHEAGHEPNNWALFADLPPALAALGDPGQVGGVSQAWRLTEQLRE